MKRIRGAGMLPALCWIPLLALAMSGCGGGGGGGGGGGDDQEPTADQPPALTTHFPCEGCRFYGDAISVAGVVTPGADGIESVTVELGGQAVDALVQLDGKWIAQNVPVPDTSAELSLTVTATDVFGKSASETISMEYAPTLAEVLLADDPAAPDSGYLYGTWADRLFKVDFATGELTLISQSDVLRQIVAMQIDEGGTKAFLTDFNVAILAVDLTTGVLSTVSDASTGTGPMFEWPTLTSLDKDDDRLIVFDDFDKSIYSVDIATGNRVVVPADDGSGVQFDETSPMVVDSAANVAILHEFSDDYIRVSLVDGTRTLVPGAAPGDFIGLARGMDLDSNRTVLAVADAFNSVHTVDYATGARSTVSPGSEYPGFAFSGAPRQLVYDAGQDRYLINDIGTNSGDTDRIFAIDPVTGDRSVPFENPVGTGTAVHGSASLAIDSAGRAVYLASMGDDNIVRVDLVTLERQLVADNSTGNGPAFNSLSDIALDMAEGRAFVLDLASASLLSVDLQSGDREILSDALIGTGPGFSSPTEMAADPENGRVYVVDQGLHQIMAVDLKTGERTIISSASNSGPELVETNGIALDADESRLLITETGDGSTFDNQLLAVEISTGDRSVISSFSVGNGPFLDSLQSIALSETSEFAVLSSFDTFYRVDLATGNRQILADHATGNGEMIFNSHDVTYDAATRLFYSWDSTFEALSAYEVATGDRVVLAR